MAYVAVDWSGTTGLGPTLADALLQTQVETAAAPADDAQWAAVRRWFARLDEARRVGDWIEFGRAYEALRRILTP